MNLTFNEVFEHVRPNWPSSISIKEGRSISGERLGFNYDAYVDAVEKPYAERPDSTFLGECMNWAIFAVLPRDQNMSVGIDDLDKDRIKKLFDENMRSYLVNEFQEEPEHERDMEAYAYVQSLDA